MPKGEELLARDGLGGNLTVLYPPSRAETESLKSGEAKPGAAAAEAAAPEIIDQLDSIRVLERGPVRSLVRIERTVHGAHVVQDLALYDRTAEISIHTRIEGGTGLGRLCSEFELKKVSPWVVHGVPFGSNVLPCEERDPAAEIHALDWIAQSTSKLCITLCNDAGASFGAGGRILSVTLDDPDAKEGGAAADAREMQCTLHVDREGWRAGAPHTAAELEHPPQVVRTDAHDGVRSPRHSFLRLARVQPDGRAVEGPRSGLLLSAFKIAEEGDEWVLRVYESKGQAGTVRFTFDRPIFAARATDLLERPSAEKRAPEPRTTRQTVEIPIAPYRIETLRVSFRPR
jgi:alpha-mannosidase